MISEVKLDYWNLQRLSDRSCEKLLNFEKVVRKGLNLVYRHTFEPRSDFWSHIGLLKSSKTIRQVLWKCEILKKVLTNDQTLVYRRVFSYGIHFVVKIRYCDLQRLSDWPCDNFTRFFLQRVGWICLTFYFCIYK